MVTNLETYSKLRTDMISPFDTTWSCVINTVCKCLDYINKMLVSHDIL